MQLTGNKQLEKDDFQRLATLLTVNGNFTLPELHGFFTSITSSPFLIVPSEWLEMLFENTPEFDADITSLIEFAMSMYNQVVRDLHENKITPLLTYEHDMKWGEDVDPIALSQWCQGYMKGLRFYVDI